MSCVCFCGYGLVESNLMTMEKELVEREREREQTKEDEKETRKAVEQHVQIKECFGGIDGISNKINCGTKR